MKICLQCQLERTLRYPRKICNACHELNESNNTKFCTDCRTLKLKDEFYHRNKCKSCQAVYYATPEQKELLRLRDAECSTNPERIAQKTASRKTPQYKAMIKKWREDHPEYYSSPDQINKRREYNSRPEVVARKAEINATIYQSNKAAIVARVLTRARNLEPASQETIEHIQWCYTQPCVYCWKPATTHDHVVPVSQGGSNHWSNMVPACSRCNDSKGAKPVMFWLLQNSGVQMLSSSFRTRGDAFGHLISASASL